MPAFSWSQSVAAGGTFEPLGSWNYETPPRPGVMKLIHRATAVGLICTWTSGSDQILQESPVAAGGTAGVTPSEFAVPPVIDPIAPFDKQRVFYRNPTGGAITVDGYIDYTPA